MKYVLVEMPNEIRDEDLQRLGDAIRRHLIMSFDDLTGVTVRYGSLHTSL